MGVGAFVGILVGAVGMGSLHTALRPLMNLVSQAAFGQFPNELVPPGSLVSLLRKGMISEGLFNEQLIKQGFDASNAKLLYKDSERLMNAFEVIALWRREGISDAERDTRIKAAGWEDNQIPGLIRMTEVIPGATDIVRFAVREVYSPGIAEQFGQYERAGDVYREAEKDIKAAGMSEETFSKFWAAHWELPSIRQGFEMIHRQVIDESALDSLMEALDIMPFWRDKLSAIAHNPYTRVDVRRMHKLGILTESEVTRSYIDLGYDQEKADNMTAFTVAYNLDLPDTEMTTHDIEVQKQKEATRGSILKAFRNNIISEQETILFLQDIGYSQDAIDLYIAIELFSLEEDITDAKLKTIHEAYIKRIFDFQTTVAGLNELNLPAKQTEMLLDRWVIEREARAAHPSKSELFKFHKNGVITDIELRGELAGHGYNERYIDWYMSAQKPTG